MDKNIKNLLLSSVIMIVIDFFYLKTIGSEVFIPMIEKIQKEKIIFNFYAAIACYLFITISLNYFILSSNKSPFDAFILGVCIYGVYETVNLATFNKWKLKAAIIDTVWGGILLYLTTYLTYKIKL